MYGADRVAYTKRAEGQIAQAEALGYGGLPICMAKTQRSLSDDPTLLGRPRDFTVTVSEVRISAGAGFPKNDGRLGLLFAGHPASDARRLGPSEIPAPASPMVALRAE